jgi:hypothetical protein
MATTISLSLEDYRKTSFSPDVDGELKKRNMRSYEYAKLQLLSGHGLLRWKSSGTYRV